MLAHNLLFFSWGDPVDNLQGKQISVSYFADAGDTELIQSLSQRDGRWFADDQPLPKFNQSDPEWKGNKWMGTQVSPPVAPKPN